MEAVLVVAASEVAGAVVDSEVAGAALALEESG